MNKFVKAAQWLMITGITILITSPISLVISILFFLFPKMNSVMKTLMFLGYLIYFVNLGLIIWGSVEVFGSYAQWTDDMSVGRRGPPDVWPQYHDPSKIYCNYTAMMTALVILILHWVLGAAVFIFWCSCCGAAASFIYFLKCSGGEPGQPSDNNFELSMNGMNMMMKYHSKSEVTINNSV